MFDFNCECRDEATKYSVDKDLKKVKKMYYELLLEIYFRSSKRNKGFKSWILLLKKKVRRLKGKMVCLFQDQCDRGLFTMKLHDDHFCDVFEKFHGTQLIDAAPHKHFKVVLERLYRRASMRTVTVTQEKGASLSQLWIG